MTIEHKVHPDDLPYLYYGPQLEYRFPLGWYVPPVLEKYGVSPWIDLFTALPKKHLKILVVIFYQHFNSELIAHIQHCAEEAGTDLRIDHIDACLSRIPEGEDEEVIAEYDIIYLEHSGMDVACMRHAADHRTLFVSSGQLYYNADSDDDMYSFDLSPSDVELDVTPQVMAVSITQQGLVGTLPDYAVVPMTSARLPFFIPASEMR